MKWITDKEPTETGRYLVTIKTDGDLGEFELHETETKIIRFSTKGWLLPRHSPQWIDDALTQKVLAWMPLPEPYKELNK